MQLHIFRKATAFSLHQLILLITLCIKVLRYNYQKRNSLQDILYFMSKCARLKCKIYLVTTLTFWYLYFNTFFTQNNERNHYVKKKSILLKKIDLHIFLKNWFFRKLILLLHIFSFRSYNLHLKRFSVSFTFFEIFEIVI